MASLSPAVLHLPADTRAESSPSGFVLTELPNSHVCASVAVTYGLQSFQHLCKCA